VKINHQEIVRIYIKLEVSFLQANFNEYQEKISFILKNMIFCGL